MNPSSAFSCEDELLLQETDDIIQKLMDQMFLQNGGKEEITCRMKLLIEKCPLAAPLIIFKLLSRYYHQMNNQLIHYGGKYE